MNLIPTASILARLTLCVAFIAQWPQSALSQTSFSIDALPAPGQMVNPSPSFTPTVVRGMHIDPNQPLRFDFIVEAAQGQTAGAQFNQEVMDLTKYFLTSLTIPENDQWVNLSPYEKNKIIPAAFDQTAMGRDLLAQDYLLKQLTASLIYPEEGLGKEFWNRVYSKSRTQLGTAQIPVNTFNKVWVVADKASLYVRNNTVYIVDSHLKVMMEEDYLAKGKNANTQAAGLSSQVVREILLPEIEKEINTGKNFAQLRQIYHAVILAAWYKKNLKSSLLTQAYADQKKMAGVDDAKGEAYKQQIFERYIQAYKKGVFSLIKEDQDPMSKTTVARKYFSGGMNIVPKDFAMVTEAPQVAPDRATVSASIDLERIPDQEERISAGGDRAMSSLPIEEIIKRGATLHTVNPINGKDKELAEHVERVRKHLASQNVAIHPFSGIKIIEEEETTIEETRDIKVAGHKGEIYINRTFLNAVQQDDAFDTLGRAVIEALVENSHERYKAQYDYVKAWVAGSEGAKDRNAFSRLPDFEGIFQKYMNIFLTQDVGDINGIPVRRSNAANSAAADDGTTQLKKAVEEAVYHIAVNAMDGKIDLRNKVRVSANDKRIVKDKRLKVGTLAFAGNPPTLAHVILASLKSMAESETGDFLILLTKGDFRKPALVATFKQRFDVTKMIFEDIFGKNGMIRVIDPFEGDDGWNGEEKVLPLAELNKEAASLDIAYAAGNDHFLSVAQKDGEFAYQKITEQNKRDFVYYAKLDGYKELIRGILDQEKRKEFKQLLEDLLNAKKLEDFIQPGVTVPVLDTISKLYLINRQFKVNGLLKTKASMINISRGAPLPDPLRNKLTSKNDPHQVSVIYNEGISVDISSTAIRRAIIHFFRHGVIDADAFAFLPVPVLRYLFDQKNREYLYFLARLQKADLPQSLILMDPEPTPKELERRERLTKAFNERLSNGWTVSPAEMDKEKVKTTLNIIDANGQVVASLAYRVREFLGADGNGVTDVAFAEDLEVLHTGLQGPRLADFEHRFKEYVIAMNRANPLPEADSAMASDIRAENRDVYGGIDLSTSDLDLDVQGDDITFNTSAAQLADLQRLGLSGFQPRIITIQPIMDIRPLFGLAPATSHETARLART